MKTSSRILRTGIIFVILGTLWLLNEWLGISRQHMGDILIHSLPYLRPIILIVIGSTLIILNINRQE